MPDTLKYYLDHHVNSAITAGLRRRGIDCLTCEEDGTDQAPDAAILQRAAELGRVVFSQDMDFWNIASEWIDSGREFSGLVFGRQLGLSIGSAIRELELIAVAMTVDEIRSRIIYIPM